MLCNTQAIVLKYTPYADAKVILHLFTREYGSVSYYVRIPSGSGRKRIMPLLRPLTVVEIVADHRPLRDIQRIKESRVLYHPTAPGVDPAANAVALLLTELWDRVLRSGQKDPELFDFLHDSIGELDEVRGSALASFHLKQMCLLSWRLGIMPDVGTYREGYVLDLSGGKFRPPGGNEEDSYRRASALLHFFLEDASPESTPLTREARNDMLDLLLLYFDVHYPGISTIRSPEILRTLF